MHIKWIPARARLIDERLSDVARQRALDSAARTLVMIEANLAVLVLTRGTVGQTELREVAAGLLGDAWQRGQLDGEIPLPPLHGDASPWAACDGDRGDAFDGTTLPWLLAAADVVGFLASLLGSGDELEIGQEVAS